MGRYHGRICKKHPELEGIRLQANGRCIQCSRDRKKRGGPEYEAHLERCRRWRERNRAQQAQKERKRYAALRDQFPGLTAREARAAFKKWNRERQGRLLMAQARAEAAASPPAMSPATIGRLKIEQALREAQAMARASTAAVRKVEQTTSRASSAARKARQAELRARAEELKRQEEEARLTARLQALKGRLEVEERARNNLRQERRELDRARKAAAKARREST